MAQRPNCTPLPPEQLLLCSDSSEAGRSTAEGACSAGKAAARLGARTAADAYLTETQEIMLGPREGSE